MKRVIMPLTDRLTSTQRAMLRKVNMQGPIVVIPIVTARALIRTGFLMAVHLDNHPPKGLPVRLTIKGRNWIND